MKTAAENTEENKNNINIIVCCYCQTLISCRLHLPVRVPKYQLILRSNSLMNSQHFST